jgi:hypothetical protein
MATAMINVRVGCIGAGQRDIDGILGIHSFATDMAEYGAVPIALDDPLWTWNAPFFLTARAMESRLAPVKWFHQRPGRITLICSLAPLKRSKTCGSISSH